MRFDYERDIDYCCVVRCKKQSVIIFSEGSTPFILGDVGLCDKHNSDVMKLVEGA
jgi:hypothetical protein